MMAVFFFVLAGIGHLAFIVGMAFYSAYIGPQAAANVTPLSIGGIVLLWLCSVTAFLMSVHRAKKFLTEQGLVGLPSFASTVGWFAMPFLNLYVPWKHLATIRNSLTHYLRTGDLEHYEEGRGATIILTVLYLFSGVADRIAGAISGSSAESALFVFVTSLGSWLLSFLYATFWLITLAGKLSQAKKRIAEGGGKSVAEVFA
jgi:hypothetical protein